MTWVMFMLLPLANAINTCWILCFFGYQDGLGATTKTPRNSEAMKASKALATALLNKHSLLKACPCSHTSMPCLKLWVLIFPIQFWQPEGEIIQGYGGGDFTQADG